MLEGANLVAQNAKELYESAEILAESKKYGAASSLMVLSAEESAKFIALMISYFPKGKDTFKLSSFFRSHSKKARNSKSISIFWKSYEDNGY